MIDLFLVVGSIFLTIYLWIRLGLSKEALSDLRVLDALCDRFFRAPNDKKVKNAVPESTDKAKETIPANSDRIRPFFGLIACLFLIIIGTNMLQKVYGSSETYEGRIGEVSITETEHAPVVNFNLENIPRQFSYSNEIPYSEAAGFWLSKGDSARVTVVHGGIVELSVDSYCILTREVANSARIKFGGLTIIGGLAGLVFFLKWLFEDYRGANRQ